MKLTETEALDISIEHWERLKKTGSEVKRTKADIKKYGYMLYDCALCEYDAQQSGGFCSACPYCKEFGSCYRGGQPFKNWEMFTTKQYAGEFLAQLYILREKRSKGDG